MRALHIGAALTAALLWTALPAGADQKIERTFRVAQDVSVVVSNPFGKVKIEGWDRPEVYLEAHVRGDLEIDAEPNSVEIELDFGLFSMFKGPRAKIELKVPRNAEVEVDGVDTRIEAKDVDGDLRLQTIQGDIRVEGGAQNAKLSTISGEIRFTGRGANVHAQSISGSIRLEGVGREVTVENTSGEIRIEGGAIEDGSIRSISGEVRIETSLLPGGKLDIETLSSPIRLALPRSASTRMSLESTSGEVRSDLGADHDRSDRGGRLDMSLGDGDGRVRIKTFSGEIRVEER